ncbi:MULTISPECIES: DUF6191 domain-containing protein [unclassified Streptomyces]|uniref:DUF6191 domain-containing protein n=1 Tax=unclassified Streptomyces TaxID=2593676 RepID=UPI0036F4D59B
MFNVFEEVFAPGRKHTRDEQKRLELTREDVGDGDPGRGPIDLASGKVVVRPPRAETDEDAADEDTVDQDAAAEDGPDGEAPDGRAPDG